jgi:hypothetical protein
MMVQKQCRPIRSRGWTGQVHKILHPPSFETWTTQPTASCYIDYAVQATTVRCSSDKINKGTAWWKSCHGHPSVHIIYLIHNLSRLVIFSTGSYMKISHTSYIFLCISPLEHWLSHECLSALIFCTNIHVWQEWEQSLVLDWDHFSESSIRN